MEDRGTIEGGTFTESSNVINSGKITGGIFRGTVTNDSDGSIADSAKVTLTFRSDGGTAVEKQQLLKGQRAVRPAAPVRDGYIFTGWYNGSTLHDFNTPITADTTLTAGWFDPADAGGKGEKGDPGADGKDGVTPCIGANGNWWIGDTDTGVKAAADSGLGTTTVAVAGLALAGNVGPILHGAPRKKKSPV